jgi:HAD superfamily hydrolase (TIGR01549 family)
VSTHALTDALNWSDIKLVVFDVDGTLYDQRGLRLCMLREMLLFALSSRSIEFIKILRAYRKIREHLGESQHEDFEQELIARTASIVGCTPERVRSIAEEWLEQRPLRHLIRYRYAGLIELFQSLRKQGKKIGIFSDYPARQKLAAMQLDADYIVCATDKDIGVLKPHPKGLQVLMDRAAIGPAQTVLIGDRPERDGLAARAAHAHALIQSRKLLDGWQTFDRYDGPAFSAVVLTD